jgi:hypothetical protein
MSGLFDPPILVGVDLHLQAARFTNVEVCAGPQEVVGHVCPPSNSPSLSAQEAADKPGLQEAR